MRTHPLNIGYLVVGLVFLGLAGSWALTEAGVVDADGIRWALPVTLVAAGAAGLLAAAVRAFRGGGAEALPAPPEDHVDEPLPTYAYDDPFETREGLTGMTVHTTDPVVAPAGGTGILDTDTTAGSPTAGSPTTDNPTDTTTDSPTDTTEDKNP